MSASDILIIIALGAAIIFIVRSMRRKGACSGCTSKTCPYAKKGQSIK